MIAYFLTCAVHGNACGVGKRFELAYASERPPTRRKTADNFWGDISEFQRRFRGRITRHPMVYAIGEVEMPEFFCDKCGTRMVPCPGSPTRKDSAWCPRCCPVSESSPKKEE